MYTNTQTNFLLPLVQNNPYFQTHNPHTHTHTHTRTQTYTYTRTHSLSLSYTHTYTHIHTHTHTHTHMYTGRFTQCLPPALRRGCGPTQTFGTCLASLAAVRGLHTDGGSRRGTAACGVDAITSAAFVSPVSLCVN